jgi:hypothetical protein
MTRQQRIEALREFGYNEREASFLALAALHSGYFVRRQYNRFVGCKHGKAVVQLVKRLSANGHSRTTVFPNNTGVYHLCSRPLYQALGDPNNRNRRRRSPVAIKTKLMALDFVLADPDLEYLATEREKAEHFTNHRSIPPDLLPKRIYPAKRSGDKTVRYFVDKLPIFLPSEDSLSPPVVSFCYVDPGARSLAGFQTFLRQYTRLFGKLGRFRLFYIAGTERHFRAAERRLRELVRSLESVESSDSHTAELLEYFRLERLYQERRFQTLTKAKLIHLKRARRRFADPESAALLELWKREGDRVVIARIRDRKPRPVPVAADFRAILLEDNYDFLDTFTRR